MPTLLSLAAASLGKSASQWPGRLGTKADSSCGCSCKKASRTGASTSYTVRRRYTRFALLDVRLETGRTHQIRVHLAHIGYPIAGDPTYGGRARPPAGLSPVVADQLNAIGRQALHACELSFVHPATQELMTFTADPPADMTQLIAAIEKYDEC